MPPKRRGGTRYTSGPTSRARDSVSPTSGDEWQWFTVEDILEESKHQYFVRWSAEERDPKTGKRYPDEWIPKETANERLVAEWEARKRGLPISEINSNIDVNQSSQACRQISTSDGRSERAQGVNQQDYAHTDSSPVSSSMPLSMALGSDAPEPPSAQGIAIQVPGMSQLDANAEEYSSQVPTQYRQTEDGHPVAGSQFQEPNQNPTQQSTNQIPENDGGFDVPSSSSHVPGTVDPVDVPQTLSSDSHQSNSGQIPGTGQSYPSHNEQDANLIQDSQAGDQNSNTAEHGELSTNINEQPETAESFVEEEDSLNTAEKPPSIVISAEDTAMHETGDEEHGPIPSEMFDDVESHRLTAEAGTNFEAEGDSAPMDSAEMAAHSHLQATPEVTGKKRLRDVEEPRGSPVKRQRNEARDASNPISALSIIDDYQGTQDFDPKLQEIIGPAVEGANSGSSGLPATYPVAASIPALASSETLEIELAQRVRELEKNLSIHKARLARVRKSRQTTQSNAQTLPSQTPGETLPPVVTSPSFLVFATEHPETAEPGTQSTGLQDQDEDDLTMTDDSTANSTLRRQITENETFFEERFQQMLAEHKAREEGLRQEAQKWKDYHAATESDYGKLVQEHLAMEQEHRGFKMNVVTLTRQNEVLVEKVQSLTGVISKLKDDLKEEATSSKAKVAEALESVGSSKIPEVAEMEKMRAEVEASNRRLASGQRDMEFIREQYQQASAAAVENNNVISKQEEELTRLRSISEGEAVKLRGMYEENHMHKARDDAQKAERRASQLEKSLRRATEEILDFKKKEAAKGMAAFTRASSNIGSRPASRAVSRRPGSPGPSQLGPGSQRTKARNGTPKIG